MHNKEIEPSNLDKNLTPVVYSKQDIYTTQGFLPLNIALFIFFAGVFLISGLNTWVSIIVINTIVSLGFAIADGGLRYESMKRAIGENRIEEDSENDTELFVHGYSLGLLGILLRKGKVGGLTIELLDGTVVSLKRTWTGVQIKEKTPLSVGELWDKNLLAFDPNHSKL